MSWGLVAGAAGTIIGGALSGDANRKAANKANDASAAALAEQQRQFDLLRADQAPYRQAGADALKQLQGLVDFNPTPSAEQVMSQPGYQFGLNQGRDALQGTAAAKGGLYSGQALKELTQFGNDYATSKYDNAWNQAQQSFGNRWNRIAGLAGIGQTSVQQTGQAGQNFANQASNIGLGNAAYQGAAGIANANILGNGINQLAGWAANRWGGAPGGGGGNTGSSWWSGVGSGNGSEQVPGGGFIPY